MLIDYLTNLFCSGRSSKEQNPPVVNKALTGAVEINEEQPHILTYDDPEIEILYRHLGPFRDGMVIEVALSDMLQWLPRQRHKSDAYKSLVRRMKALGLQLRVGSQYSPINNETKGSKSEEE